VNLHVENGATILFRTDSGKPLIAAIDCENIAVTGAGTLDGQSGHATASFIQFYRCKNVVVGRFSDRADGVTIERSPGAGIHPVLCTNVTVRRVRISSLGPGNDGCDLESCKDVLIENTLFNTAAAGIAIRNGPSENIIVRGCELRDGHEGVTISGDETGGVRNVFVDRCTMDSPHLDRAVRLTHNAARGGLLEHIYVRDVTVREATDAVLAIDVPIVRDVEALRVTSNKSTYGIAIRGQEQSTVDEVRLIDCSFDGVQKGNVIERANAVRFQNTRMNGAVVRF
jgi:polygalacturonase